MFLYGEGRDEGEILRTKEFFFFFSVVLGIFW